MELVWAELKRFLRKVFLKSKQEIADRVKKFFDEIMTLEKCQTYITRVKEVNFLPFSLKDILIIQFNSFKNRFCVK